MKKIAKRSVEVEVQPEDIASGAFAARQAQQAHGYAPLRKVDIKKVGIVSRRRSAVVLSAVSLTGAIRSIKASFPASLSVSLRR